MEYTGLILKYKLNRSLSEQERADRLKPKQRFDVEPLYDLQIIRMNSTFLETCDKYYGWKGFLTWVTLLCSAILIGALVAIEAIFFIIKWEEIYKARGTETYVSAILIALIIAPVLALSIWALLKDAFTYTHYPIRFNRKTRMVHVFRPGGKILSVPWDTVFFTVRSFRSSGFENQEIVGHILADDGVTITDTFPLGVIMADDDVRKHWEYIRRYMEDGPQELLVKTYCYLPIAFRKETYLFGLRRLFEILPGVVVVWVIGFPLFFVHSLGRWIAMQTSKIPQWPAEIEAECRIEPGDLYERDERHNVTRPWQIFDTVDTRK